MGWDEINIIAAAVVGMGTIVGAFFRWVLPTLRKIFRLIDRLVGVPANPKTGQKEVPGLFETLASQNETLATQSATLAAQNETLEAIKHEVQFNSGSSVKDAIIRVETKLDEHLEHTKNYTAATVIVNPPPAPDGGTTKESDKGQ